MFYYYLEGNGAPTLALGFTDVEAAKEIFAGWSRAVWQDRRKKRNPRDHSKGHIP
jgi:hypothetical protein